MCQTRVLSKGTFKTVNARQRPRQQLFQLHKGTIKMRVSHFAQQLSHLFQFHKGTIKTAFHMRC